MSIDAQALDLAVTQGGVILRSQARALGFTDAQVRNRYESGRWVPVPGGGFRLLRMSTAIDRVRAAVTVLPNAVASHETAAELHGIGRVWRGLAVVSVHTRTTHSFPDVVVRRNHDLLDEHIVIIDRVPVTSIARTVVDLAGRLTEGLLCDVIDDLMTSSRLTREGLGEVIDVVARRGRPGSAMLNRIREEYVSGAPVSASMLERRGRALLVRDGLPAPEHEYPIPWSRSQRFDEAFPEERVAIEWDSRRWHMRQDAFDTDRWRDNEAALHGWTVFRFTWRDVNLRPDYVCETVRRAVEWGLVGSGH